jgi:hypothetical protein
MRRVLPWNDSCHMHLLNWEPLVGRKNLAFALLVVIASATALQAQSSSAPSFDFQTFSDDESSRNIDNHRIQAFSRPESYQIGSEPGPWHTPMYYAYTNSQSAARLGLEPPMLALIPSMALDSVNADSAEQNQKESPGGVVLHPQRPDFNQDIYYRNRLEFGLDVGWHPINIPFVYDFAVGDSYNMTPLKYTLVPIIASLRWHVTNVGWRWVFRGNMDFTFSGSITPIPRGPETHYYAFMFGIRRNFVYRNWRVVPFFEERGGAGMIDAKEPLGVLWAQGQNLTFTYNMGAGIRYNLNSKYSFSAGMNYMHISNGYLSEPQFVNYGINVYGPMFGMNVRLGKPRHHATE